MTSSRKSNSVYRFSLGGDEVAAHADGTALFDRGRLMVVSDLHLEKGRALSSTSPMPLYDTDATLDALEKAVLRDQPERLLFLGDSFHRADLARSLAPSYQDRIHALARGRDVIWITGNHDPDLPAFLPGAAAEEILIGSIWFRHIALEEFEGGEVSGHYHPKARIKTRARGVSGKCFIHDGRRLIMPAFGAYTGGLSVGDPAMKNLFGSHAEILFCHACQIYRYPYSLVQ
ncbi:ligase-associated DNA damage response endonuclease PdeM [Alphaproteobacteria bacterium LSUCC0684]